MSNNRDELLIRYVQGRASELEMSEIEIAMIDDSAIANDVEALVLLNQEVSASSSKFEQATQPTLPSAPTAKNFTQFLHGLFNPFVGIASMSAAAVLAIVLFNSTTSQNQPTANAQAIVAEVALMRVRGADDAVIVAVPSAGAVLLTFDAAGLSSPVNIAISGASAPITIADTAIQDDLALAVVSASQLQAGKHSAQLKDLAGSTVNYEFVVESR